MDNSFHRQEIETQQKRGFLANLQILIVSHQLLKKTCRNELFNPRLDNAGLLPSWDTYRGWKQVLNKCSNLSGMRQPHRYTRLAVKLKA
jgi:hypothetical protein